MLSMERNAFLFRDELCEFFLREKYKHCNLSNSTRHELPYVTVR
jgi:hypothetical protein